MQERLSASTSSAEPRPSDSLTALTTQHFPCFGDTIQVLIRTGDARQGRRCHRQGRVMRTCRTRCYWIQAIPPENELGGSGRVHDRSTGLGFRQRSPKPVFLAGGLKPTNVARAIAELTPFGVDLLTRVRTDEWLDRAKLVRFMDTVPGVSSDEARVTLLLWASVALSERCWQCSSECSIP